MTGTRGSPRRPWSLVLILLIGAAVAAVFSLVSWGMYEAFQEEEGPGGGPAVAASPSPIAADEVDAAFETALDDGVLADDPAAWRRVLPAKGTAKAGLAAIWRHLSPLDFGALDAEVTRIPGEPGVFEIEITGTPGGAGPDDRILVDRVLEFERRGASGAGAGDGGAAANDGSGGGLVAVGDHSPTGTKREYLMAYRRPQMVRADGVVVIYDDGHVSDAQRVAWLVPAARERVAGVLGERSSRPIVAFVYTSRRQVVDYLADSSIDERVTFFSRMPTTLSSHAWSPADIGVVADNLLLYEDEELQAVVTHETTHAVTWRLFFDTAHDPMLLSEGLAVATADNRSYLPLRNDLTDGALSLPLLDAFAVNSLWQGSDTDRVVLAYLEGGATVKYVLENWGVSGLKAFCRGVADSDLTPVAIKQVVRTELGVTWAEFFDGWVAYVNTLP